MAQHIAKPFFFVYDFVSGSEEDELNDDVYWQEEDERVLEHVAEERWHLDARLLSDRLDHEVRTIANIGEGSEEYSTHRDSLEHNFADASYDSTFTHR